VRETRWQAWTAAPSEIPPAAGSLMGALPHPRSAHGVRAHHWEPPSTEPSLTGSALVLRHGIDRGRASTRTEDPFGRSDAAPGLLSPSAHDPQRAGAPAPESSLPCSPGPARDHLSWGSCPLQHIQDARSVQRRSSAPGCQPRLFAPPAFLAPDAFLLVHPGDTREPLPRPQHSWGSPSRVSATGDRRNLSARLPLMRLPCPDRASTATSGSKPGQRPRSDPLATKRGALTSVHGPLQGVPPPGGVDIRPLFMTSSADRNSPGFASLQGLSRTAAAGASTRLLPHA